MKEQRWKGDSETVHQEFQAALREEQHGMRDAELSHRNDYLADERQRLDSYQKMELEPSWCSQLDVVGMQPHAREYLERDQNNARAELFDHPAGIHFDGCP